MIDTAEATITPGILAKILQQMPEGNRNADSDIHRLVTGKSAVLLRWLPHYTTNLNDAKKLVPEGCAWNVGAVEDGEPGHRATAWVANAPRAFAETPELALCIAALQAHCQRIRETM
jgi:hypothetical protein